MRGNGCGGRGTDRAIRVGEMEQRREGKGVRRGRRGGGGGNGCSENGYMARVLKSVGKGYILCLALYIIKDFVGGKMFLGVFNWWPADHWWSRKVWPGVPEPDF